MPSCWVLCCAPVLNSQPLHSGLAWCWSCCAYGAPQVSFLEEEKAALPGIIQQEWQEQRRKLLSSTSPLGGTSSSLSQPDDEEYARFEAEGVYFSRLQSLATTMDKVHISPSFRSPTVIS